MKAPTFNRWFMLFLGLAAALGSVLTTGCSGLLSRATAPPRTYTLDATLGVGATTPAVEAAPTLIITPTRAGPGFDSQHIVYERTAHQLEHFARSDWVDTPARMLAPLVVSAALSSGVFRAIGAATSGIAGDLRLDTEVLRLQQEFGDGPSRVRFGLRATLTDNATRQVISWREFEETVRSESEDPYGGVVAANQAVQLVMQQLAGFCTLASEPWRVSKRHGPKADARRLPGP